MVNILHNLTRNADVIVCDYIICYAFENYLNSYLITFFID